MSWQNDVKQNDEDLAVIILVSKLHLGNEGRRKVTHPASSMAWPWLSSFCDTSFFSDRPSGCVEPVPPVEVSR